MKEKQTRLDIFAIKKKKRKENNKEDERGQPRRQFDEGKGKPDERVWYTFS